MRLQYRNTQPADVDQLFVVRAQTRDNPIPLDRLAEIGITPASTRRSIELGQWCSWVAASGDDIVGFCSGDMNTGEVLVLALLPEFEGQGIGRRLLSHVVAELKQNGFSTLWLAADSNSKVRAHGIYRKLGWQPNGESLENGDEILLLRTEDQQ